MSTYEHRLLWISPSGEASHSKGSYKKQFGKKGTWPLLIESLMSGVEISFTLFVDQKGSYQILPTAMDYFTRMPRTGPVPDSS